MKLWTLGSAPLPTHLQLDQLKKQAKELVKAQANREPAALAFLRAHHPAWASATDEEIAAAPFQLSDAQWAVARCLGASSWPALVHRLGEEDEETLEVPLVPVRGVVVFPGQRLSLHIGRPRSLRTIEAAQQGDGSLAMVAQRAASQEAPLLADLHPVGTLGRILAVAPTSEPQVLQVQVEGRRRIRLERLFEREGVLLARVRPLDAADPVVDPDAARRSAILALQAVAQQLRQVPHVSEALTLVLPHMHLLPAEVQQQVLETNNPAAWVLALSEALRALEP